MGEVNENNNLTKASLVRRFNKFNRDEFSKMIHKRKESYSNSFLYIYIRLSDFTLS